MSCPQLRTLDSEVPLPCGSFKMKSGCNRVIDEIEEGHLIPGECHYFEWSVSVVLILMKVVGSYGKYCM